MHTTRHPEDPLWGGTANKGLVVRVRDTVRRPLRPTSASTHALLQHLTHVGFDGAPRFLGIDQSGREVLSYVPGQAVTPPYPTWALTDQALDSVAHLLRAYHDAVSTFDPAGHPWPQPVPAPFRGDIVSHNDPNLDNIVFRNHRAVALIDFDLAGPGSRVWDVAAAARLWAPLRPDPDIPDARRGRALTRLHRFADAYGLADTDRALIAEAVLRNHDWCYDVVRHGADAGHAGFTAYWQEASERAQRTRRWYLQNMNQLQAAVNVKRDSETNDATERLAMTDQMIILNNGVQLPALGLGALQSEGGEATTAVSTALKAGYRLIDTAAAYFNEREVGQGISDSGVKRQDVFLTTKLWMTDYGFDSALRAFDTSIAKLGVDYLDLYLLHWPWPANWSRTVAAYKAAERLLAEGRVRAIGVANFKPEHLHALTSETNVVPAVNQVELHPNFQQPEQIAAHRQLGIVTQAWSPIGGVYGWAGENGAVPPLQNETIGAIAKAHGKTPAQVILRWHLQQGRSAIPKSVKPERISENADVFDFELTADDLRAIDALDTGRRGAIDPDEATPEVIDLTIDAA